MSANWACATEVVKGLQFVALFCGMVFGKYLGNQVSEAHGVFSITVHPVVAELFAIRAIPFKK